MVLKAPPSQLQGTEWEQVRGANGRTKETRPGISAYHRDRRQG